jgi:hypothetical protein
MFEREKMNEGLIIGRIFIFICILIGLFCIVKADRVAQWTYNFRKKDWNLTEKSIPILKFICRFWNLIMVAIFIYLFITLPRHMH